MKNARGWIKFAGLCLVIALQSVIFPAGSYAEDRPLEECAKILTLRRDDPAIYCRDQCFINAGELARVIETQLAAVNLNDLKILVFKHKKTVLFKEPKKGRWSLVGNAARGKSPILWRYHAVLSFNGFVLDLDLANPKALPLKDYLDLMFPQGTIPLIPAQTTLGRLLGRKSEVVLVNIRRDLVVKEIPVKAYLNENPERPPADTLHLQFQNDYDFISLEDYLRAQPQGNF